MTNSDLRDARDELDARISGRRARDRRLVLVAVAVAVAVVAGIAGWKALGSEEPDPAPKASTGADAPPRPPELSSGDEAFLSGDPLTPELLEGVWRLDNPTDSRMLLGFTADGSVRYDDTGQLTGTPVMSGTYAIEGDRITVEADGGQAGCSGRTLEFRGAMNSTGVVHLIPVDAEPYGCGRPLRRQWVLERLMPPHVYADFVIPPGRRWDPVAGPDALLGTWLASSAKYVIELLPDGSFTTLGGAGEMIDRGTWTTGDATRQVTLVSAADSPSCRVGDTFRLLHLRARDIGALALQGDLERNDCNLVPWEGWVKLAP